MFKSMTSFGRYRETIDGRDITVEIKSVNNRFFECQIRIPRAYAHLEPKIKPYLQSRGISRGKVDVNITVSGSGDGETEIAINREYAKKYIAALKQLKSSFSLHGRISVMDVARNPEVFTTVKTECDEAKQWQDILAVLSVATDKFLEARKSEGKRIEADLVSKIDGIRGIVEQISAVSEKDIDSYKIRLEEKIRAALADNNISIDENRILTECAIYADKAAIDEEIVRLQSHFVAFDEYITKEEPVGRSLDFLLQEMNREVNTIGSKCANSVISRHVIDIKTELEKIREQIQNIE